MGLQELTVAREIREECRERAGRRERRVERES